MVSVDSVVQSTSDAHRQIFTAGPFLVLHHGTLDVRNDCMSVFGDGVSVFGNGMSVYNTLVDVGNDHICIYRKFGLEVNRQLVSDGHAEVMERTLKMWRILLRSNLQAAIASLSFFEWKIREIAFRLPPLTTPLRISATALRLRDR